MTTSSPASARESIFANAWFASRALTVRMLRLTVVSTLVHFVACESAKRAPPGQALLHHPLGPLDRGFPFGRHRRSAIRRKHGHGPAAPGDHDLLARLGAGEHLRERLVGFTCTD